MVVVDKRTHISIRKRATDHTPPTQLPQRYTADTNLSKSQLLPPSRVQSALHHDKSSSQARTGTACIGEFPEKVVRMALSS